ncbi:MAG: preprotein translocase subunit YajC [Verrucomicrobiota bacterium]
MTQVLPLILAEGAPPPSGSPFDMFVPLILIFGLMYFLMIRPQRQKQKAVQKQISEMKTGDRAVTIGGIHGLVANIKKSTVVLKVDDGTRIEFDKSAVASITKKDKPGGDEEKAEDSPAEEEKK